jgi:DNA-binding NtrC family response regulator
MKPPTNILVVDDEEVVRRAHVRTLMNANCRVHTAANGTDALRVLESEPFDIVLLDLRMPGIDGMSVLKTVKARWPEAEVIVITGYPCVETAKEAIRLGAHDYLAKPLAPEEVIAATCGAIAHKRWSLRREHGGRNPDDSHGAARNPASFTHC